LTGEISYGPAWSESAKAVKCYVFKYYGIRFADDPKIDVRKNDRGFDFKLVEEDEIAGKRNLSNIVKLLFSVGGVKLDQIPVSWRERCAPPDVGGPKPDSA
jgi:hypothetical protein